MENDIFKAEILWESGVTSITDVEVPKIEVFNAALTKIKNKETPMWIIRQEIVEKHFINYRKYVGQGGVVLGLVDENGKRIVSD